MTSAEMKAKLGIYDAEVTSRDNGASFWVRVSRENNAYTYRHSIAIADDASDEQIAKVRQAINDWWADTIEPIKP